MNTPQNIDIVSKPATAPTSEPKAGGCGCGHCECGEA